MDVEIFEVDMMQCSGVSGEDPYACSPVCAFGAEVGYFEIIYVPVLDVFEQQCIGKNAFAIDSWFLAGAVGVDDYGLVFIAGAFWF